jgi:metal-responsive CopG/Arc/MetJ family transcriptional regulator
MINKKELIPMTIRLPNELYEQFRDKVTEQGYTRVGIIRRLIREFLTSNKDRRKD